MIVCILCIVIIGRVHTKPVETDDVDVIVGNEVVIECDIDNNEDNVVIWKHGNRVLFAGDIRVTFALVDVDNSYGCRFCRCSSSSYLLLLNYHTNVVSLYYSERIMLFICNFLVCNIFSVLPTG